MPGILEGKKGLVVGIANDQSIAYGCARTFKAEGAELAVTYLNEKSEKYVRPLAEKLEASLIMPLDVTKDKEMKDVFAAIKKKWGKLDFLMHSIAFAPLADLHGRVTDSSREGFSLAMDISCHSFIRMAQLAEPLMKDGGCLLTTSYYGGQRYVENYSIMGPTKAALESSVEYLAAELGRKKIRVLAVSPGPIMTRAASGIGKFYKLLVKAEERSAMGELIDLDDVAHLSAFLVSDRAKHITGSTHFVDSGYHIMG